MPSWTNALQVFANDVVDEGPERVVSGTKLAGANLIVLMVHHEETAPVGTPHNPKRKTNWGRSSFPATVSRYPLGLVPAIRDEPESDGKAAYDALQNVADSEDVRVVPWTWILRTPPGTDGRNRTINMRGRAVEEWLCPNGPDTLEFATAVVQDIADQFHAPAIFVDRIRFPSVGRDAGSIDDGCACFCDGCFDRARSEGVDLEAVRRLLLGWVDLLQTQPTAAADIAEEAVSSVIRGMRAASERPELLNWLKFRHRTITNLVERLRGSIPRGTELWLDTWQPTEGWLLGQDLQELAPFAAWIKPFFYHQIVTWSIPKIFEGLTSDTRTQHLLYDVYLKFFGYQGPPRFETFAEHGLLPDSITTEMTRAKAMLRGRAKLAAGVGIWDVGPDGVREVLARAAAAEPDGVWMHCYSWATMDELAAAGEWLREHGLASPPWPPGV